MNHVVRLAFALMLAVQATLVHATSLAADAYEVYVGDFNSDGYDDLYFQAQSRFVLIGVEIPVPLSVVLGDSFLVDGRTQSIQSVAGTLNTSGKPRLNAQVFTGDFNGDGRTDLLYRVLDGSFDTFALLGSSGGLPSDLATYPTIQGHDPRYESFAVYDANGDGKTDIVFSSGSNVTQIVVADIRGRFPVSSEFRAGQKTVGEVPLSFDVTATGTASFSIPVPVAAGLGMEPKLSVDYSNQAGNGLLGVGWSVGGYSVISRCTASTLVAGGKEYYGRREAFCMDGSVLLPTSDSAGAGEQVYRTEADSFAKVVYNPGRDEWRVHYKSGEQAIYAERRRNGVRTQVWALTRVSDVFNQTRRYYYTRDDADGIFLLNRIDFPGGDITFEYDGRPDIEVAYRDGIRTRTAHRVRKIVAHSAGGVYRSLAFNYLQSPSTGRSLLKDVSLCGADGACTRPTQFTWIGDDALNQLSLTAGVRSGSAICANGSSGTDGVCNDEDNFYSFMYGELNGDGLPDVCWRSDAGVRCAYGSKNGFNGSQQIITAICANGTGCADGSVRGTLQLVDINTDGYSDLVYTRNSTLYIHYFKPSDETFGVAVTATLCASGTSCGVSGAAKFADINGDAALDVCTVSNAGIGCRLNEPTKGTLTGPYLSLGVCKSGGIGQCNEAWKVDRVITLPYSNEPLFEVSRNGTTKKIPGSALRARDNKSTVSFADVNGDGKAELVFRNDFDGIQVYSVKATPSSSSVSYAFQYESSFTTGLCNYETNNGDCRPQIFQLSDINSDGLADFCYRSGSGVRCDLSTGQNFSGGRLQSPVCNGEDSWHCNDADNHNSVQFIDMNDDGWQDLVFRSDNGIYMFRGDVNGFKTNIFSSSICKNGYGSTTYGTCNDSDNHATLRFMDADGNGRPDIVYRSDNLGLVVQKFSGVGLNDYLADVRNGYGYGYRLRYGLIKPSSGIYQSVIRPLYGQQTNGAPVPVGEGSTSRALSAQVNTAPANVPGNTYPLLPVAGAMTVVGQVVVDTSPWSETRTLYKYEDFMLDLATGEGTGFSSVTKVSYVNRNTRTFMGPSHYLGTSAITGSYAEYLGFFTDDQGLVITPSPDDVRGLTKQVVEYSRDVRNRTAGMILRTTDYVGDGNPAFNIDWVLHRQQILSYTLQNTAYSSMGGTGIHNIRAPFAQKQSVEVVTEYEPTLQTGSVPPVLQTLVTTKDFDTWGNATQVVTQASGTAHGVNQKYETVTENSYQAAVTGGSNWILGRLARTRVTKTVWHDGAVQDQSVRESTWSYKPNGVLESESVLDASGAPFTTKTYTYDGYGNVITTTTQTQDGETRYKNSTYSADGRFLIRETNSKGHSVEFGWDPVTGDKIWEKSVNGQVTRYRYDGSGRQTEVRTPDGKVVNQSYSWLAKGYQITTTDNMGGWSAEQFDAGGRPIAAFTRTQRRSDPVLGDYSDAYVAHYTTYNHWGETDKSFEPVFVNAVSDTTARDPATFMPGTYYSMVTERDILRRPTTIRHQTGLTSQLVYGLHERTEINELGQKRILRENLDGSRYQVQDHLGSIITYTYDADGNMTQMTNSASGNAITRLYYDHFGRKIAMEDPDMGRWEYLYNGFGEQIAQRDAEQNVICQRYDELGRMVFRGELAGYSGTLSALSCNETTADQWSRWTYDTAAYGKGLLARTESSQGYVKVHEYDTLSRPIRVAETFNNETLEKTTRYDARGRVWEETLPVGEVVRYNYDKYGALLSLTDPARGTAYWQRAEVDARGQTVLEILGQSLLMTQRVYEPARGLVTGIQTLGVISTNQLQLDKIRWDEVGNMAWRSDEIQKVVEHARYDALNRLSTVYYWENTTLDSQTPDTSTATDVRNVTYDKNGNIRTKWNLNGDYQYGENTCGRQAGPHAVTSAGGYSYCYNARGDMISGAGRTIEWTLFGKPSAIEKGSNRVEFVYGPDRARILRRDLKEGQLLSETRYFGNYERVRQNGLTQHKYYIGGVAVVIRDEAKGTRKEYYMLRDHLGSVTGYVDAQALLNGETNVVERTAFDPWGLRRQANWKDYSGNAYELFRSAVSNRGYTGHEQIDSMGLIHMNGRVYDPKLGRFLSADPHIQAPENTQSLNRYAYVLNNPLSATDPSGYFSLKKAFKKFFKGLEKAGKAVWKGLTAGARALGRLIRKNKYLSTVINMVACVAAAATTGPIGAAAICGAVTAGTTYAVTGDFTMAMKAGVIAFVSTAMTAGLTQQPGFAKSPIKLAAVRAGMGGVFNRMQGGSFGRGALAAAFSSLISGRINTSNWLSEVAVSSVIGGTASRISGGKFANGAVTAAFSYAISRIPAAGRKVSDFDKTMARISKDIYDPTWESIDGFELQQYGWNDEGLEWGLYVNKDGVKIVAFAGTDPADLKGDILQDLIQGSGFVGAQYRDGMNIALEIRADFYTGHSLGGGIAAASALATDAKAVTFNAAAVHRNTISRNAYAGQITQFNSNFDLLQVFNTFTPMASVRGEQISLGGWAGLHGMAGVCMAMGC